ncbi:MAG: LysM peptidoglycan-binding domain-containing protein [Proteobacteria bacterium]|nr:LysM peptidoglycan-binding domain-containing protein [Pseudomonadota bacterium]MBU4296742.1 LysM peptidoglycan-binding domain-containing protein [Pseudomonadota bacterium]MCG2745944.1 LysM peptidoglycan-binding domain-containing protein [Desulfobulbaceae bacterium]
MRDKPTYLFLFILPFLLASMWGCAATDSTTRLPVAEATFAADEADDGAEALEAEVPVDEITVPEPEVTVVEEMQELETLGAWVPGNPYTPEEASYDFPVTMNKQVEFYLDFFQNKQRDIFTRWLERSTRYLPMIKEELRTAGLPQDLAYLPMIESGYSLTACSTAKAVGPWQFMHSTALDYGLEINRYVDDRRDPEKSTRAAIAFLSDLYDMFGDWQLAVAAYNAGGGTISKGIKNSNATDFWELAQEQYLPSETKRYVPKLIAAIIIAKNPEKYGFTNINYEPPLTYETVEVPALTSLRAVEVACETDLDELRTLNRNLPKLVTPPYQENYELKVPVGQKDLVAENLPRVRQTVTTDYKTHVVDGRENLTKICRLYGINKTTMLKANNLRKSKLTKGQRLRIPYQITNYALLDKDMPLQAAKQAESRMVLHKVKRGETIALIANRYNVTPKLIASWNGLRNINQIKAGQQLALYVTHTSGIVNLVASRSDVKRETVAAANPAYYKVQNGDTLWTIARRFDLTPDQLRQWNNLDSDLIHPGTRLQVSDPEAVGSLSMLLP